jgi:hypothetical protein
LHFDTRVFRNVSRSPRNLRGDGIDAMTPHDSFRRALTTIVVVLAFTCVSLAGAQLSTFQLMVTDRCTWEPEQPGWFYSRPDLQDLSSCGQFAAQQGYSFTGSGETAWSEAKQVPNTPCICGAKTAKWFFDPSWGQYACSGFGYSCTKPGSGCTWVSAGSSTLEVATSEECRSKALASGTYYGWGAKDTASKAPECGCTCGESRAQWYSENNSSTGWRFVCGAFRFSCSGKATLLPRIPAKVLEVPKPLP